jgi:dCTP diphosphatase
MTRPFRLFTFYDLKRSGVVSQSYIQELQNRLHQFAVDREWEQFHAPKNLAMALAVEAGELMEHFQWMSEAQSEQLDADKLETVGLEVADVFIFTVRLADRMGIDLEALVEKKIKINEQKYPVEKVRGSSKKYTEYEAD